MVKMAIEGEIALWNVSSVERKSDIQNNRSVEVDSVHKNEFDYLVGLKKTTKKSTRKRFSEEEKTILIKIPFDSQNIQFGSIPFDSQNSILIHFHMNIAQIAPLKKKSPLKQKRIYMLKLALNWSELSEWGEKITKKLKIE